MFTKAGRDKLQSLIGQELKSALQYGAMVAVGLKEKHNLTIDIYGDDVWTKLSEAYENERTVDDAVQDLWAVIDEVDEDDSFRIFTTAHDVDVGG